MQKTRIGFVTGGFVALLAACVGGPGPLPGPGETGDVGGAPSPRDDDEPPRGPVTLKASDYDQACEADGDCVAIFEGNACAECACPNAAIATSGASQYASDLTQATERCDRDDIGCTSCEPTAVSCDPDTKRCVVGGGSNGD